MILGADRMKKYIHYCWFGDKPLPKLAKKCIDSWKKYLPDYEIIKWSEENVDLNECPFIKEAYANKKWAFVADYTRTKALNEMGGIYFDTDMEVTKNVDDLLAKGSFLGVEDTGNVNSAVWYEKGPKGFLSTELLKKYRSFKGFDPENASNISIPLLITEILNELGFDKTKKEIQKLPHDIFIYPRDYFYPYSFNWDNNIFTDNTCMIHYFDASWIPLKDRIEINMVRKIGRDKTYKILHYYRKTKDYARKTAKVILFPVVILRDKKRKKARITEEYLNRITNTITEIKKYKNREYIAIHNGEWMGVTSATKELFDNTVDCRELYRKEDIKSIGDAIIDSNIKQVIFSAMSIGDRDLAIYLKKKNKDIKIKSFWHGSHSQIHDYYGWARNVEIINLHRKGIIDVMGTCKKSLMNFYENEGFKAHFLTNKVTTSIKPEKKEKNNKEIIVGLYAAKCDDWRKNMYCQMAAVSLIDNAVLDMVPLNDSAIEFAKTIGLKIQGEKKSLSREKLLKRISKNDINLYVTYSECAPMLPLESFEMGVPCILGNNCHYFMNSELEKYIVVNNEESPEKIKETILNCLNNKEKVLKMYDSFQKDNLKKAKKAVDEFIKL